MAAESRYEGADLTERPGTDPMLAVEPAESAATEAELASDVARHSRGSGPARIVSALRDDPHSFSFFQAVRLLQRLRPETAKVGGFDDPAREAVRFAVPPSLAFPASEIQELELADRGPAAMRVNFMGLTGPLGVLPHAYTLLVADRVRSRDSALGDFLDLFHHRLLSLFYRAWSKYRFAAAQEDGASDPLANHLLDLIGLGLHGYRDRMPFPDDALIFRAGLLIMQPRGAASLGRLLEDVFDVAVAVEQFVGAWYPLAATDRCIIGEDDDPANRLGCGAVAGDEIWDQQARVRIRLGPLTRAQHNAFLPGGDAHDALAALLRFYSHDQFEFEVQLVLVSSEVPALRLGGDAADEAPRLGWSTWIQSRPRAENADEAILTLQARAVS